MEHALNFQLLFFTTEEKEEVAEALFEQLGLQTAWKEYPVGRELEKTGFPLCFGIVSSEDTAPLKAVLESLLISAGFTEEEFRLECKEIRSADWHEEWKKYFHTLSFGERLVLVPAWEEEAYLKEKAKGKAAIRIDPGLAFGTGGHATTATCLEQLDTLIQGGEQILDFGCGSGVLALASLALGAESATGVEIDEDACENARQNALLNKCGNTLTLLCGDVSVVPENRCDILLANVTADIIIDNLKELLLRCSGLRILLLSGIHENRVDEMRDFLSSLRLPKPEEFQREEWFTFQLTLHGGGAADTPLP